MYTLVELALPTPNKLDRPAKGLSFELPEQQTPKQRVLTGHQDGVITFNAAKADDAHRENIGVSMHEPSRMLLGISATRSATTTGTARCGTP